MESVILRPHSDGALFEMEYQGKLWRQDARYAPCIRVDGQDVAFGKGEVSDYRSGLGAGFRALFAPRPDLRFETLVWVEASTGHLHCDFVPLSMPRITEVRWPAPLVCDDPGSYAVITNLQGYLLPTDWPQEAPKLPFNGQMASCSAYMPWYGEVSPQGGYLAYFRQSWDTAYEIVHPAGGPTRLIARHLPSLGRMDAQRRVTYVFTGPGSDYNALCEQYRGFAEEEGLAVTLREKAARCPSLVRLIGSSVVHLETKTHLTPDSAYYDKRPGGNDKLVPFAHSEALLRKARAAGAGRMYLHLDGWGQPGYDNQHPDYLPACKEAGGWEGLKKLADACHDMGGLFGLHDQYRDYYLDAATYDPDNAVQLADGTIYEMARWAGGRQNYLCSALAPAYVKRNYEEIFAQGIEMDCVYLDVFTCNEPDECVNPRHVVTRAQCLTYRRQCFDYMLSRGVLPSSEEVADWAMQSLVFCHWAPYASAGIPVPLFNLVYHDCILIPWMLDKGSWGTPEGQSGFLHALLNGGMGYLKVELEDEALAKNIEQCRVVSALQERVAHAKMCSHEFLSEDKNVQRTTFEGGVTVTVDFAAETNQIPMK